jgi:hypothetical protein
MPPPRGKQPPPRAQPPEDYGPFKIPAGYPRDPGDGSPLLMTESGGMRMLSAEELDQMMGVAPSPNKGRVDVQVGKPIMLGRTPGVTVQQGEPEILARTPWPPPGSDDLVHRPGQGPQGIETLPERPGNDPGLQELVQRPNGPPSVPLAMQQGAAPERIKVLLPGNAGVVEVIKTPDMTPQEWADLKQREVGSGNPATETYLGYPSGKLTQSNVTRRSPELDDWLKKGRR